MHLTKLLGLGAAATLASSVPTTASVSNITNSQLNTAGFLNPHIVYSQGKHAVCAAGTVPVQASTDVNVHLSIPSNLTADQVIQIIINLGSANSSAFLDATTGANTTIGGTWNISSRLCFPVNYTGHSQSSLQVQLLSHGIGFDQSYWDFSVSGTGAGNYSYVDYAAQQNQITFAYDRLGIASSQHPDPIQDVQGPLELEILHSLVTDLRSGKIGNVSFESVVGVGHSFGSQLTGAVAREYPSDFDAIVLTGFSNNKTGGPQFTSSLNLLSAENLSSGYIVPTSLYGVRYAFFSYPDYDDDVLAAAFRTVETTTLGEQMTMSRISEPAANFTRPVYILVGEKDLLFCDANCNATNSKGLDVPAATLAQRFPSADVEKSGAYILDGSGHGVNLAANAHMAFEVIQEWIAGL